MILVDQAGAEMDDAVGQLVPDDIEGDGESVEQPVGLGQVLVAVAVDHLAAVPKGVVVSLPVVHGGIEPHAVVVE